MNDLPLFLRRYFQSLAGCAYFFAGGALLKRHRPLLYALCKHFGFEKETADPNAKPAPTVPKVAAAEIIRDDTAVALSRIADVAGNITPTELMLIAAFVKQRRPAVCFEIGTFDGRTTENMAANQPADGKCYTLDLPPAGADTAALPLASGDKDYIVKPVSGGLILWHDYDSRWWPGVTRALNQLQGRDPRFAALRHVENTALCFMER